VRNEQSRRVLLTIDIGSSNVTLGLFAEGTLLHTYRLQSRREQTSDEYALALLQLVELSSLSRSDVAHVIIASVVPALSPLLSAGARRAFGCEPLLIRADMDMGIVVAVERPLEVGVDRIVNVVAARERLREDAGLDGSLCGAIVVDLGTATTLDCLSPAAELVGGVIVPGMRVSFDALIARTARLPEVELVPTPRVLGKNTRECLQSGIVHGYASLVEGLLVKLKRELGFECRVFATGGLATVIAPLVSAIDVLDAELTLYGLERIWRRQARA
jgi:type III pantothenate kinase